MASCNWFGTYLHFINDKEYRKTSFLTSLALPFSASFIAFSKEPT